MSEIYNEIEHLVFNLGNGWYRRREDIIKGLRDILLKYQQAHKDVPK